MHVQTPVWNGSKSVKELLVKLKMPNGMSGDHCLRGKGRQSSTVAQANSRRGRGCSTNLLSRRCGPVPCIRWVGCGQAPMTNLSPPSAWAHRHTCVVCMGQCDLLIPRVSRITSKHEAVLYSVSPTPLPTSYLGPLPGFGVHLNTYSAECRIQRATCSIPVHSVIQ